MGRVWSGWVIEKNLVGRVLSWVIYYVGWVVYWVK